MNRYPNIINPFTRIAGAKALLWGLLIMILTTLIAFFSRCHFDGVLDAHVGTPSPLWKYAMETALCWSLLVACFYLAGRIFSTSHIRLIDVAGTMALARAPLLLVALAALIRDTESTDVYHLSIPLIIMGLLFLAFSIWMLILLYHAYTVSCNLKGSKALISFIGVLICAEAISKIILNQFY